MRILFIHQAFPSQFKNLAPQLARDGHDVHSLSARRVEIPGVESHTYSSGPSHRALGAIDELQVQVVRGSMVASMGMSMRALGFIPDIVITHSGWGARRCS